jgi:ADP-ribose pyrophosphatase YjhB (NUDIX family)
VSTASSPSSFYHHCPRCSAQQPAPPAGGAPFNCAACGFTLYFNAATAVAVFVRRADGRTLFIRRAKDPAKGKLAPPGGFVDIGETVEAAARREIREEVGIELNNLTFLSSHPNSYHYRDVTYPVLDFFFTATAGNPAEARALDDVASVAWLDAATVPLEEIAFPSMRAALEQLRGGQPDAAHSKS